MSNEESLAYDQRRDRMQEILALLESQYLASFLEILGRRITLHLHPVPLFVTAQSVLISRVQYRIVNSVCKFDGGIYL
jgi:hypothetical protein